jgi:hypothetical protein
MRRLAFLLLLAVLSCHRIPPQLAPASQAVERVLARDIRFIYDSVPIVKFRTPFLYGVFRLQVESCSGRTRDGWPAFYLAPVNPLNDRGFAAAYFPDADAIVFGLGSEVNEQIIRHELLHWLLRPTMGHPPEFFGDSLSNGKCGHLLRVER